MLNLVEHSITPRPVTGHTLNPIFDDKGLIPCVAPDAKTKQILLFAWMAGRMDRRAFEHTISTGIAHYLRMRS